MGVDLETVKLQSQGICLDCDCTRAVTKTGCCEVCGSHSVLKHGAVAELARQIKIRDREARKAARRSKRQTITVDKYGAHDCPEEHSDTCRQMQRERRGLKFYAD